MKVLLVDNFDSFSYNLVHYFEQLGAEVFVETNVSVQLESLKNFDAVVLSPGPGLPKDAGKLMDVIAELDHLRKPTLGVCLGMQALAQYFGDELYNQTRVKHGLSEILKCDNQSKLYQNLPEQFKVGLYHSWAVKLKDNSPFLPTAFSENEVLMSIEHKNLPFYGVQYHPESILSENGLAILGNFLK